VNGELLMSDVRIYNNPDARILWVDVSRQI
jgi:hypothetical protein